MGTLVLRHSDNGSAESIIVLTMGFLTCWEAAPLVERAFHSP